MTPTLTHPILDHLHEHHHHPSPEPAPVISQRWKWMTVVGNAAIGLGELVSGNFSTMSVTADGLHNIGDTATYYMQAENILDQSKTEQQRSRLRKIAHWVIAATSLGASAKAGIDLSLDHESVPHAATIYAATASLALNGAMLARLRRGIRRKREAHASVYERDLSKHFWAVDIPSAGLAVAGAVLQRYNVHIEQVAAAASGVVGAYAFRPTKANLAHNCLDYDHGSQPHEHIHTYENAHVEAQHKKNWLARTAYEPRHGQERQAKPPRVRRAMAVGVAALALAAGLVSGDTHTANTVQTTPNAAPGTATTDTRTNVAPKPHAAPKKALAITDCIPIQPGDSQWKIIKRRIARATGEQPSTAATNAITMFTALNNKQLAPNPNSIASDTCLQVPSRAATRLLSSAVERPHAADSQLAADLHTLNNQPSIGAVMHKQAEQQRISAYLRGALAPLA